MIYFNKVRDVKSPTQAYNYPAGTDFYVPNYNQKFKHDLIERNHNTDEYNLFAKPDSDVMTITVMPHGQINIPSGIRVEIANKDSCLLAVNKSGVATKLRLDVAAALVDADYHGEITLSLTNTSDHPVSFNTGDKLFATAIPSNPGIVHIANCCASSGKTYIECNIHQNIATA